MNIANIKSKAILGIKWTGLSTGVKLTAYLIQAILLARYLGPEEFGIVAVILIIIGFGQLMTELGFTEAIIQSREISKNQLSTMYWINLIMISIICSVLLIFSSHFSKFMNMPELKGIIPLLALGILLLATSSQFNALLKKDLEFISVAKIDIISTSIFTILVIYICIFLEYGAFGISICFIIYSIIKSILLIYIAKKNNYLPKIFININESIELIKFGLYRLGGMFTNYVNLRVDQILIGSMIGASALGMYNISMSITREPIKRIIPIITKVTFPYFSLLQDDLKNLKKSYLRLIELVLKINIPLYFSILYFTPTLVPIVFGDEWLMAIPMIQIFCIYSIFVSYENASSGLIIAKGFASWSFWWNFSLMLILPVIFYLSASYGDVLFVCYIVLFTRVIITILNYILRIKRIIGDIRIEIFNIVYKPLITSILTILFLIFINSLLKPLFLSNLLIIIKIISAIIFYLLATWKFDKQFFNYTTNLLLTKVKQ